jgi:hypothetical protein
MPVSSANTSPENIAIDVTNKILVSCIIKLSNSYRINQ